MFKKQARYCYNSFRSDVYNFVVTRLESDTSLLLYWTGATRES